MNGSRSAARIGGSTAFRTAMTAATRKAEPGSWSATPGTIHAATATDAAATTQATKVRTKRRRGVAGSQLATAPYAGWPGASGTGGMRPLSHPPARAHNGVGLSGTGGACTGAAAPRSVLADRIHDHHGAGEPVVGPADRGRCLQDADDA